MRKKNIIFFLFIFLFCSHTYADRLHKELIENLEKIYPVEIYFQQFSQESQDMEGWMVVGGKGKVRTEFKPPNNLVIIGTGKWLIFHDAEFDRTTYLPMDKGILNSLLNPSSLKEDKEILVLKTIKDDNTIFKIEKKNIKGNLRIYFKKKQKLTISKWIITDENKNKITVDVIKTNKLENSKISSLPYFSFNEGMKNSKKVFLGPYERNIKKIPKSGRPGDS